MKVSVEVKRGAMSRRLSVTAHSIDRALKLAGGSLPVATARVIFPIDPEEFFQEGLNPTEGISEAAEMSDPPDTVAMEAVT